LKVVAATASLIQQVISFSGFDDFIVAFRAINHLAV